MYATAAALLAAFLSIFGAAAPTSSGVRTTSAVAASAAQPSPTPTPHPCYTKACGGSGSGGGDPGGGNGSPRGSYCAPGAFVSADGKCFYAY